MKIKLFTCLQYIITGTDLLSMAWGRQMLNCKPMILSRNKEYPQVAAW